MLFKSKKKDKLDEKFELVQASTQRLMQAVSDLTVEVTELQTQLQLKDEKIQMLESILRSDEVFVDPDTKMFNRLYFDRYIGGKPLNDYSVITIRIRQFDVKNQTHLAFRRNLAKTLIQFCINHSDTAILWADDTVKLILEVPSSRLPQVKDTIIKMLDHQFKQGNHSLSMSFKPALEDPDLLSEKA